MKLDSLWQLLVFLKVTNGFKANGKKYCIQRITEDDIGKCVISCIQYHTQSKSVMAPYFNDFKFNY